MNIGNNNDLGAGVGQQPVKHLGRDLWCKPRTEQHQWRFPKHVFQRLQHSIGLWCMDQQSGKAKAGRTHFVTNKYGH